MNPQPKGKKANRIKPKRRLDPERLKKIRGLSCIACAIDNVDQTSKTEAHHIKRKADGSTYGTSQKAHDDETIPLCEKTHHWNGVHCASKLSHKEFERIYGNERDLLSTVNLSLEIKEMEELRDQMAKMGFREPTKCPES